MIYRRQKIKINKQKKNLKISQQKTTMLPKKNKMNYYNRQKTRRIKFNKKVLNLIKCNKN